MGNLLFNRKVVNLILAVMLLTVGLAEAAFAQATAVTSREFDPFADHFEFPGVNGGAGEFVLISGILHIQTHVTIWHSSDFQERQLKLREVMGWVCSPATCTAARVWLS